MRSWNEAMSIIENDVIPFFQQGGFKNLLDRLEALEKAKKKSKKPEAKEDPKPVEKPKPKPKKKSKKVKKVELKPDVKATVTLDDSGRTEVKEKKE